jgi:hypothetical protein
MQRVAIRHQVHPTLVHPLTGLIGLLTLAVAVPAQTTSVVSPADRGTLEGSTSTSYPVGRHDSRFQQLFDDIGKARTIAEHSYRRDALSTRGTIAAFRTSLAIKMSVAAVVAEKANKAFASNVGTSPTTVLPKTWVSFPKTTKPGTVPAKFELRVPYKTPYAWKGKGTLCVDMTIDSNVLATGTNKTFSASLDAQELFASGRNLQPGYRFGKGCNAPGRTTAAAATFELRHLGKRLDLFIAAKNGLPNSAAQPTRSVLLVGATATKFPWPFGTGCNVYTAMPIVVALAGNNSSTGGWRGVLPVGTPPRPGFEMVGQILSFGSASGPVVLSDASRLIAPPAGKGVVSSRIVSASDRTKATGTVSFSVPITEFR